MSIDHYLMPDAETFYTSDAAVIAIHAPINEALVLVETYFKNEYFQLEKPEEGFWQSNKQPRDLKKIGTRLTASDPPPGSDTLHASFFMNVSFCKKMNLTK